MADRWENCPTVFIDVTVPECPWCGTTEPPIQIRSEQVFGERRRKLVCKQCSADWKLVLSFLPMAGNAEVLFP